MNSTVDECQDACELLSNDPDENISIVVGATLVGPTSCTHLLGGGYVTPDVREPGQMTLPAASSRYRLILPTDGHPLPGHDRTGWTIAGSATSDQLG